MTTNDLTLKMGRTSREVLAEIVRDIRDGLYEEDAVLASFSDLHDHVDANEYVSDLFMGDEYDDMLLFQNAVADDVDAFLKRHPITVPDMETCTVCGKRTALSTDEERGWVQSPRGFVAVCSEACSVEFFAEGGGIDEAAFTRCPVCGVSTAGLTACDCTP